MMIDYTLSGTIQVPDGSKLNPTRSGIILPDGKLLKLWEAWELNEDADISASDLEELGCWHDGDPATFEERE